MEVNNHPCVLEFGATLGTPAVVGFWAGQFLVINFAHHVERLGLTNDYSESVARGVFL